MDKNRVDLVIFDLGGTTVRVEHFVPEAFREALRRYSVDPTTAEISAVRGRSKQEAIAEILQTRGIAESERPSLTGAIFEVFRNVLSEKIETEPINPIAQPDQVFASLQARGIRVALATGFDGMTAKRLVSRMGWTDKIDALISADDVPAGRPAPYMIFRAMERTGTWSVKRTAVVGDTEADLWAAENAGAGFAFGVLSGAHSANRLKKRTHTAVLADIRQVLELIVKPVPSPWL
jgi:phosphonatase-like hydrolase